MTPHPGGALRSLFDELERPALKKLPEDAGSAPSITISDDGEGGPPGDHSGQGFKTILWASLSHWKAP